MHNTFYTTYGLVSFSPENIIENKHGHICSYSALKTASLWDY